METLTGDQNVSQFRLDRNSFLIVRGCASVPFNAVPIPFFAGRGNLDLVYSHFRLRGGKPSRFGWRARLSLWVVGPFWLAFVFSQGVGRGEGGGRESRGPTQTGKAPHLHAQKTEKAKEEFRFPKKGVFPRLRGTEQNTHERK